MKTSVAEPELEPQGAGTFCRSQSWSRYTEVSAPAPGQTKVVYLIIIRIEQDKKSEFFTKCHDKSTFSFKSRENRYPKSLSRSQLRSRIGNFLKVGAGARAGTETNSFGSATLMKTKF
jgi:thiamine kinase-like enzyme